MNLHYVVLFLSREYSFFIGFCNYGITGLKCNQCLELHYGYSSQGCKNCSCSTDGSTSDKCDELTGQCDCIPNVTFRKCDGCSPLHENFPNCTTLQG